MMFVIFIIIGIISLVKAGGIKKQIPKEEAQTEDIMNWLSDNILQEFHIIQEYKEFEHF